MNITRRELLKLFGIGGIAAILPGLPGIDASTRRAADPSPTFGANELRMDGRPVAEVTGVSGPAGSVGAIVTVELNFDPRDLAGQGHLRTARAAATRHAFEIIVPDLTIRFDAFVTAYHLDFATDDVVKLNVTLRITGPVTFL